jgi:decaprenyl-phosphate phosphoribosyltransferase
MKYLKLLRLDHTFKSIFIIPGIFYALFFIPGSRFDILNVLYIVIICQLVSSANYTINEYYDREFDKFHPIKKSRPSVVNQLNGTYVLLIYFALLAVAFGLSYLYATKLLWVSVFFAFAGFLYNIKPFRFKDLPVLDILWESVNNPVRFFYGLFIVNKIFDINWTIITIILSYWFFGSYLMALKRYSELKTLEKRSDYKPSDYRKSFAFYTEKNLLALSLYFAIVSNYLISYVLHSLSLNVFIIFPVIALLFPYYFLLSFKENSEIQHPEKLHKNKIFLASIILITVVFSLLYYKRYIL